jgi:hypothetical protein
LLLSPLSFHCPSGILWRTNTDTELLLISGKDFIWC